MSRTLSILLAEDDPHDVFLLQRAFRESALRHPLDIVQDGQEAIERLEKLKNDVVDRLPALIILDLKMPRLDGLGALKWIRSQPLLRLLPTVIFTSSAETTDVERAYRAGATGYFVKPPSVRERAEVATLFKQWLERNFPPLISLEGFRAARAFSPEP